MKQKINFLICATSLILCFLIGLPFNGGLKGISGDSAELGEKYEESVSPGFYTRNTSSVISGSSDPTPTSELRTPNSRSSSAPVTDTPAAETTPDSGPQVAYSAVVHDSEPRTPDSGPATLELTDEYVAEPVPAQGATDTALELLERNALNAAKDVKATPLPATGQFKGDLVAEQNMIYSYSVARRGYIRLVIGHSEFGEDFNGQGTLVAVLLQRYSSTGDTELDSLRVLTVVRTESESFGADSDAVGVLPGEYVVVITAIGAGITNASVRLEFAADGFREVEPNDSFSRYTELPFGTLLAGSSSNKTGGDSDFYLFRPTEPGYAVISFEHDKYMVPSITWRVTLLDETGAELWSEAIRASNASIVSPAIGVSEGSYYLRVESHVYISEDYKVSVDLVPTPDFESEPNDDIALADELIPGIAVGASMSQRSGGVDRDRFVFTAPKPCGIGLVFKAEYGETEAECWNVTLTDAAGTVLLKTVVRGDEANFASPLIGVPAGDYYITIDNDGLRLNTAIYAVEAVTDNSVPYEVEPNDSFRDANALTRSVSLTGSLVETGVDYDKDCFVITTDEERNVTVNFRHDYGAVDDESFVLTLYDEDGAPVVPLDKNGDPVTDVYGGLIAAFPVKANDHDFSVTYYSLPAGTYYLTVDTGRYFIYSPYRISYSF